MAATGEITWSSAGKKVERFVSTPIPTGDYDLKLNAAGVSVKRSPQPGKLPYVSVMFEALGTATTDEGKNRKVFHNFFLHMNKGKDGKMMLERQGGVLDLANAIGEDIKLSGQLASYQKYDKDGDTVGEVEKIPVANAKQVEEWLKSHDGLVVRAHVKVERPKGYNEKNVLDYFIPGEAASASEAAEEYSMDESAGSEEEETPAVEEEGTEEVEESAPEEDVTETFKPKTKAPPSKVAQGPVKKGAPSKRK